MIIIFIIRIIKITRSQAEISPVPETLVGIQVTKSSDQTPAPFSAIIVWFFELKVCIMSDFCAIIALTMKIKVECPECGEMLILNQPDDHSEYVPFGTCENCKSSFYMFAFLAEDKIKTEVRRVLLFQA